MNSSGSRSGSGSGKRKKNLKQANGDAASTSSLSGSGPSSLSSRSQKVKKAKLDSEATENETFQQFMHRIQEQRKVVGDALSFKFVKSRCKNLSEEDRLSATPKPILYWMSRDQRVEDNWALLYAQRIALKEKVPFIVCFCLVPKFLEATLRMYSFMLRGLQLLRDELLSLKIPFHLLFGEPKDVIPGMVKKYDIGGIVSDFSPLRIPQRWVNELLEVLPSEIPICQVDAHNIVPIWVTSDKLEYAARTIRPKIHAHLEAYLTEFPPVVEHSHNRSNFLSQLPNPFEDWAKLISCLQIDKTVDEVDWAKPGTEEGFRVLKTFLEHKLISFDKNRNNPNEDGGSNLSPWFHFGQISVSRCISEAKRYSAENAKAGGGVSAFIEEAVIRRELSDNFCFYNQKYDSLEGAADWAQRTLKDHSKDKREPLYTLPDFEHGRTYDDLWNAAQHQMVKTGKMHGFLRMYWAKKILEWSPTPENALEVAIYLNDKYSLDGRDPNGYVGCAWSICGVHDQGFVERPIFGKIRFMNYAGCKRKFDVPAFVAKYKTSPPKTTQVKKNLKN